MMRRLVWLLLLLVPALARAQERRVTVDVDFLTRGELRYGGLDADADGDEDPYNRAAFLLGRSRIGAEYEHKGFSANLTAQYSGVWGDDGAIGVYEAWTQYKTNAGFFVKLGRQNLSYDDQRIFGSDSWSMTGMSHDVLKAGYEGHGHKVHLFGAYNQNASNMAGGSYYAGGYQSYKALEALWYHYDLQAWNLGMSAVFMDVGMQGGYKGENEQTYHQQLLGGYLTFTPKRFSVEAAYYRQMGKEEHGLPIEAWMASAKVTATPSDAWQFTAGYDYLSGDDSFATPRDGEIGLIQHEKIKGFNSIFGSHHKFYGAMDFFYVTTYVNGFTPGLQNVYAGAQWKPVKPLTVDAGFHFFAVGTVIRDMSRALGHELELSVSWSLADNAALSMGYSYMNGTELMEVLKRTSDNHNLHWAWLMLTVHPKLQVNH